MMVSFDWISTMVDAGVILFGLIFPNVKSTAEINLSGGVDVPLTLALVDNNGWLTSRKYLIKNRVLGVPNCNG